MGYLNQDSKTNTLEYETSLWVFFSNLCRNNYTLGRVAVALLLGIGYFVEIVSWDNSINTPPVSEGWIKATQQS